MSSFLSWLRQLQFGSLIDGLLVVIAAVLSITVHESCHGLAAWWLGDPTAKRAGRISLNPLRHIDVFGLILLAVAIAVELVVLSIVRIRTGHARPKAASTK